MAFRNFEDNEDSADGINLQEREDTEYFQKITDMLLGAGYFRARLNNIEPFDKILGGLTWCITGLMYSAEMDFRDDLTLGEKVKLSEKVTEALEEMRCPHVLYPHQIQNCNYERIMPVMGWLINLLLKTRDTRSAITRKQAVQNFNRRFNKNTGKEKPQIEKIYDLNDKIKPKRAFKSTKTHDLKLEDPKRVHSCLREFNDPTASRMYKKIIEDITKLVRYEEREKLKNDSEEGLGNMEKVSGDSANKLDSIAKTIKQIKKDKEKGDDRDDYADINEVLLMANSGETVMSELDEEISKLKQKTFKVKAGDVNQILSQNIDQLSAEVHNFKQLSEETLKQDEEFFLQSRKEELERELKAFQKRKENKERQLEEERSSLEQKKLQIKEMQKEYEENKILESKLNRDIAGLAQKISQCAVTEQDLQKVYRKDQLKTDIKEFKKRCREERDRLEEELERIRKKNEELEKEEHAKILKSIEDKYNKEYDKLMERKKKIAEQNRQITALQRKIENCPSKIELSQYHKRFTELYESINDKFEENRKYVSLFNTKEEVNLFSDKFIYR